MAKNLEALSTVPEGNDLTVASDRGTTVISEAVVAKIAGIAAREVDGVHQIPSDGIGKRISSIARRVTGGDLRGIGVNVEVGKKEAAIDMSLIVEYGVSIPKVASAVRENVMSRIREMTGLIVKEVNLEVSDLFFPEDVLEPVGEARVQ